jgi:hypothetical protein
MGSGETGDLSHADQPQNIKRNPQGDGFAINTEALPIYP